MSVSSSNPFSRNERLETMHSEVRHSFLRGLPRPYDMPVISEKVDELPLTGCVHEVGAFPAQDDEFRVANVLNRQGMNVDEADRSWFHLGFLCSTTIIFLEWFVLVKSPGLLMLRGFGLPSLMNLRRYILNSAGMLGVHFHPTFCGQGPSEATSIKQNVEFAGRRSCPPDQEQSPPAEKWLRR
jgi:hypothetical protein